MEGVRVSALLLSVKGVKSYRNVLKAAALPAYTRLRCRRPQQHVQGPPEGLAIYFCQSPFSNEANNFHWTYTHPISLHAKIGFESAILATCNHEC